MENATASQWLQTFKTIYDTKYITPYIHAFTVHLPHMISKLRNLNINICHIACDSLEKKHGLLKQQYFHRTNRGGLGRNPDIQILEIQNREYYFMLHPMPVDPKSPCIKVVL
jgi:hypothetical protein